MRPVRTIVTIASSVAATVAVSLAGAETAQAQVPLSCDLFNTGMVQRDSGTAIDLWVDHKCWFGQQLDIVVQTTENGQVIDRFALTGSKFDGRTVRRVELTRKPLCDSSTIKVRATYKYLGIGDDYSSERQIYYDPNDNCGA